MFENKPLNSYGNFDLRDSAGYAINEVVIGLINKKDKFIRDYVHHANDNKEQSKITVSSTDPWHRTIDIDSSTEQLGIDRLFSSRLNNWGYT